MGVVTLPGRLNAKPRVSISSSQPGVSLNDLRLILTFLIPLHLLRGSFPSQALLELYPRLQEVYQPFIEAIRSGNVREYDERLEWAQPRLVGMSTYLAVERAREGCLRMLFKKAQVSCLSLVYHQS